MAPAGKAEVEEHVRGAQPGAGRGAAPLPDTVAVAEPEEKPIAWFFLCSLPKKPIRARSELVLVGPVAVSRRDDVLVGDKDPAAVGEHASTGSFVGAGGVLNQHIPRHFLSTGRRSADYFQGDFLWA